MSNDGISKLLTYTLLAMIPILAILVIIYIVLLLKSKQKEQKTEEKIKTKNKNEKATKNYFLFLRIWQNTRQYDCKKKTAINF